MVLQATAFVTYARTSPEGGLKRHCRGGGYRKKALKLECKKGSMKDDRNIERE